MREKNNIRIYDFMNLRRRHQSYAGFGFESVTTLVHQHADFYEIILITDGIYHHVSDESTTTFHAGTLLLFKPGVTHQLFTPPQAGTHFVMCIEQNYFEQKIAQCFPDFDLDSFADYISKHISKEKQTYIIALGKQLVHDSIADITLAEEILHLCILDFLSASAIKDVDYYITDMVQKFNNGYYMNMSAEDIYAKYPFSKSVLLSRFKKATGMTIAEYRTEQKMKYAARLLTETNTKIIHIAIHLQYDGLSYFLRTFKKMYGMTPSEYRKKHKKVAL